MINLSTQREKLERKYVTITDEVLESLQDEKGNYSNEALQLFAAVCPIRKGWKTRIIGKKITRRSYIELLELEC